MLLSSHSDLQLSVSGCNTFQGKADRNHNLVSYSHSGQSPIYCSSKSHHCISLWFLSENTCQRNSEVPSKHLCKHKGWVYHGILCHVMFVKVTISVQIRSCFAALCHPKACPFGLCLSHFPRLLMTMLLAHNNTV